jgi:hypothetical protein
VVISPDSGRVIYRASTSFGAAEGLYSVPIEGPTSRNVLLVSADAISPQNSNDPRFRIAGNGRTVVYVSHDRRELHAVPVDGTGDEPVRLTVPVFDQPGATVGEFEISPDGQFVFFRLQETATTSGLYRALVHPPGPPAAAVRLGDAEVSTTRFLLSAADKAVYFSGESAAGQGVYRVPITGHVARQISEDIPNGFRLTVPTWKVTPDGKRVVYRIAQVNQSQNALLFSGATSGPRDVVRIDAPGSSPNTLHDFRVSPDSSRVVFLRPTGLSSVPVSGPTTAVVHLTPELRDTAFALTPDGSRVVTVLKDTGRLVSVPIGGPASAIVELGGAHETVGEFVVGPTRVAYSGRVGSDREDLFTAPVDGAGPHRKPTAEIENLADVSRLTLFRTGQRALYITNSSALYSSPLNVDVLSPRG